jgi:hypothetical protein
VSRHLATSLAKRRPPLEAKGWWKSATGEGVFITQPPETIVFSPADALANDYEQLPAIIEVRQAIERPMRCSSTFSSSSSTSAS